MIGSVDSDTINDFPTIVGQNVKQIKNDDCIRALLLHLNVKGSTLIHSDSLDLRSFLLREQFEEFSERHSGTAVAQPKNALVIKRIHHCGIAMLSMDGKLVNCKSF